MVREEKEKSRRRGGKRGRWRRRGDGVREGEEEVAAVGLEQAVNLIHRVYHSIVNPVHKSGGSAFQSSQFVKLRLVY